MDNISIDIAISQTTKMYKKHFAEFSDSRSHSWKGWDNLTQIFVDNFSDRKKITLLDVGCGNLRFEKFLESILPNTQIECTAVDNCPELLDKNNLHNTDINFCNFDIVKGLKTNCALPTNEYYDLVVIFGLLHHIPSKYNREKLIDASLSRLHSGGLLAMSYWQFMKDEKLSKKALLATKDACQKYDINVGDNDYFLNWGNDKDSFRFCHNFTDSEVDEYSLWLKANHNASLLADFYNDGPNNNLNRYIVFSI